MMSKKTARLYQRMQHGIQGRSDEVAALEQKAAKAEQQVAAPVPAPVVPAKSKSCKVAAPKAEAAGKGGKVAAPKAEAAGKGGKVAAPKAEAAGKGGKAAASPKEKEAAKPRPTRSKK